MWSLVLLVLVALPACGASSAGARGANDPRVDAETGRAMLNYAPGVPWDHQHMKLEMTIADMREAKFLGVATVTSVCRLTQAGSIGFDARETMAFTRVVVNGKEAKFRHVGARLEVDLPDAMVERGAPVETRMEYVAENPQGAGVGLVWLTGGRRASDKDAEGGEADGAGRQPQVFSQGQANWNSFWFPCHDSPNDRLSSELVVLAPLGFEVISNGALVERAEGSGVKGKDGVELVRWHWRQEKPHPAYLVMLAIGKFAKVELALPGPPEDGGASMLGGALGRAGAAGAGSFAGSVPMRVLGPVGTQEQLRANFGRTGEMVRFFEALFDEPYPWEKYDQVIVRGFRWGGMENTSATILADYAGAGAPGEHDDLIAHELAHQWTGNLVTCAAWEHVWLNEGWATYAEWLWVEHTQGRAAYDKLVRDSMRKLLVLPLEPMPKGVAMVSGIFNEPDETFEKVEDPYVRGALVLHALRRRVGDEAFLRGVRLYIDRHKLTSVETVDLRRAMEDASGEPLERFIFEMAQRPGVPRLTVRVRTVEVTGAAEVTVVQRQEINSDNPAYEVMVPVRFSVRAVMGGREMPMQVTHLVRSDRREVEAKFTLSGAIDKVEVDPELSVLGEVEVDK